MTQSMQGADDAGVATVANVIRNRRTTNLFEPEPVGTEILMNAIDLARWAPNHRLSEPWRFYVFGPDTTAAATECWVACETELKGEAAGAARRKRLEAVPGHFVLSSLRDEDAVIDRENYAACCCAAQNLMLYLWQRGVGVKWTSGAITREQRLYDVLGIDSALECIVGYFWYGRPKIVADQKRRSVDEIAVSLP